MGFTVFLFAFVFMSSGDPPKADPLVPGVRESQLSVEMARKNARIDFRATALFKEDGTITILTAGHAMRPSDVGNRVRVKHGSKVAFGRVQSVIPNPNYRPPPSGDVPGADNAMAQFRLENATQLIDELETADLAGWPTPDPDGQTVPVQMLDQFGKGHAIRGGNYSSPRWLEWGPSYAPIPGDSGSGVFVVRRSPEGITDLILIGVVVDRVQRGGGASLLSLRDPWVAEALREYRPKAKEKQQEKAKAKSE